MKKRKVFWITSTANSFGTKKFGLESFLISASNTINSFCITTKIICYQTPCTESINIIAEYTKSSLNVKQGRRTIQIYICNNVSSNHSNLGNKIRMYHFISQQPRWRGHGTRASYRIRPFTLKNRNEYRSRPYASRKKDLRDKKCGQHVSTVSFKTIVHYINLPPRQIVCILREKSTRRMCARNVQRWTR